VDSRSFPQVSWARSIDEHEHQGIFCGADLAAVRLDVARRILTELPENSQSGRPPDASMSSYSKRMSACPRAAPYLEQLMHLTSFRIANFRRLKAVRVDLEADRTIFVGANNSGKTSATHALQLFLSKKQRAAFRLYDFTADCWSIFDSVGVGVGVGVGDLASATDLPRITLDLWFEVDDDNVHRAMELIPSLDWEGERVGVRLEYAPRDGDELLRNFAEARTEAHEASLQGDGSYRPWPQTMTEYLTRRLQSEYEIKYYVLDARRCDGNLSFDAQYEPYFTGTHNSGAARVLDSLIRIDFLNAQRHLVDSDQGARGEDLSRRLSRFYERNLQKLDDDTAALVAIADSEARLNEHFADVFGPTLDRLSEVGYPGVANPGLVVRASFSAQSILSTSARVHYALPHNQGDVEARSERMLPDQYNGLGFKNLIYMVVEILDFHEAWAALDERPPIHMIVIEEPEAHLHAQLQQVFIRKVLEILPANEIGFQTQLLVTTHSPHLIYESNFKPIRYFCRSKSDTGLHLSDVKNLSVFHRGEEVATAEFLQQYIKLTHCDLFFADGVVLVEGNVERLLLPLVIERFVPELRSSHLTILEVGGAFAHRFESLLSFLAMPTLVITDLDSVSEPEDDDDDDDDGQSGGGKSCPTHTTGATTSNQSLAHWFPEKRSIEELLAADADAKTSARVDGSSGLVRVAYQTREHVQWHGEEAQRAGRTLEEAFALQNLEWTQGPDGRHLGLNIRNAETLSIEELHDRIYKRVQKFDKTKFALGVIATVEPSWRAPSYIVEGLEWLRVQLLDSDDTGVESYRERASGE
jgi:predicted ATP-dependent endonuclease of OLD family